MESCCFSKNAEYLYTTNKYRISVRKEKERGIWKMPPWSSAAIAVFGSHTICGSPVPAGLMQGPGPLTLCPLHHSPPISPAGHSLASLIFLNIFLPPLPTLLSALPFSPFPQVWLLAFSSHAALAPWAGENSTPVLPQAGEFLGRPTRHTIAPGVFKKCGALIP